MTVPWVNVLGNHDYGGSSYIYHDEEHPAKCANTAALLQAIDDKFNWQSLYVSPHNNRWIFQDHFYIHQIEDPVTGVSVDFLNLDTNNADIHGATQICCQMLWLFNR